MQEYSDVTVDMFKVWKKSLKESSRDYVSAEYECQL